MDSWRVDKDEEEKKRRNNKMNNQRRQERKLVQENVTIEHTKKLRKEE